MKYIFISILILFSSLMLFAQRVEQISGFKSGKFGMDESSLSEKEVVYESSLSKTYKTKNDDLKFGDVSFFQIDYVFYDKKLRKIIAHCEGSDNARRLIRIFYEAYGDYKKEMVYGKKDALIYVWSGNKVTLVIAVFDDFTASKIMFIDNSMDGELWNGFKKTVLSENDKKALTDLLDK